MKEEIVLKIAAVVGLLSYGTILAINKIDGVVALAIGVSVGAIVGAHIKVKLKKFFTIVSGVLVG